MATALADASFVSRTDILSPLDLDGSACTNYHINMLTGSGQLTVVSAREFFRCQERQTAQVIFDGIGR
jgi:hypothetical protein